MLNPKGSIIHVVLIGQYGKGWSMPFGVSFEVLERGIEDGHDGEPVVELPIARDQFMQAQIAERTRGKAEKRQQIGLALQGLKGKLAAVDSG